MGESQGGQAVSIEELKRENEILKDALCMEQDRLSHARHHIQNTQERIKRLEESENRLLNWLTEDCPESVKKQLSNAWIKYKEAKP